MKSFLKTALVLAGMIAWGAGEARAQINPSTSSLFPLSIDAPGSAGVEPAAYNARATDGSRVSLVGYMPQSAWSQDAVEQTAPCDALESCDSSKGMWYGSLMALAMTRNRAPALWTTTASNDPLDLRMNTQNAGADWAGGGQVNVAYAWRGCGGPAVAFTYWGLTPMNGSASVSDITGNPATALSSTIGFGSTLINGLPASTYFNNAQEQAIWRRDRTDNFEMNVQSGTYTTGNLQVAGLMGFRYFRFSDSLTYGSASFGNSFTSNGGGDAAYLNFQCHNSLYGGQLGAILSSLMTRRVTVFAVPKVGVYGNTMVDLQQIYGGSTVNSPVSYFHTNKTDVSVLSELDTGVTWACNANVKIICGYRVISVTNLALADNQFGAYNHVEQSGSLILHGAFLGFTWLL